jgi:hypothetical protein
MLLPLLLTPAGLCKEFSFLLFLGISKNSSLSNQNTYTLPWLAGSYHQQTHRLFSSYKAAALFLKKYSIRHPKRLNEPSFPT